MKSLFRPNAAWPAVPRLSLLLAGTIALAACGEPEVPEVAADTIPTVQADTQPAPAETASVAVGDVLAQAAEDSARRAAADTTPADSGAAAPAPAPRSRYKAGTDPEFARRHGWPVEGPAPLPGAILPANRIVCYYGNPNSKRMGALGEYPKAEMLSRLQDEVARWSAADPSVPAKPCLHMVSVVAQGDPGTSGHYRSIMRDRDVEKVYGWAKEIGGIFFVDIQVGTDDIRNLLPRFDWILKNPDVHLAIDPEFMMKAGHRPGTKIGTMDAADINYASEYLAKLVREHDLPPKVLVIHRFTQGMVTNHEQIRLRPEVQIVIDMDGWGAPWLKRDSYRDYIVREPVQYTGFKLFYHNDTKKGDPLMSPRDVLELRPQPLYIQYQ